MFAPQWSRHVRGQLPSLCRKTDLEGRHVLLAVAKREHIYWRSQLLRFQFFCLDWQCDLSYEPHLCEASQSQRIGPQNWAFVCRLLSVSVRWTQELSAELSQVKGHLHSQFQSILCLCGVFQKTKTRVSELALFLWSHTEREQSEQGSRERGYITGSTVHQVVWTPRKPSFPMNLVQSFLCSQHGRKNQSSQAFVFTEVKLFTLQLRWLSLASLWPPCSVDLVAWMVFLYISLIINLLDKFYSCLHVAT